jgi:molybdenum cofactor cytidylyltransferase
MDILQNNQPMFATLILAAGKSSRMGVPKWSLAFDRHQTFVEHLIQVSQKAGSKEIIVVVNVEDQNLFDKHFSKFPMGAKWVINEHPEWERLYSLQLGLQPLTQPLPVLVCNIDHPFLEIPTIQTLLSLKNKADYAVPTYQNQGGHPILISNTIVQEVLKITEPQIHLKSFLQKYTQARIAVQDPQILSNINTPEDYLRYFPEVKALSNL